MTEVCMSQINYAQIQPLIGQVDVQNRTVRVVFKCPITGEEVNHRPPIDKAKAVSHPLFNGH